MAIAYELYPTLRMNVMSLSTCAIGFQPCTALSFEVTHVFFSVMTTALTFSSCLISNMQWHHGHSQSQWDKGWFENLRQTYTCTWNYVAEKVISLFSEQEVQVRQSQSYLFIYLLTFAGLPSRSFFQVDISVKNSCHVDDKSTYNTTWNFVQEPSVAP